ncbi:MAG: permease [bacterium]|nr:permease [bacterium]MDE0351347.1 permease [bacterium]
MSWLAGLLVQVSTDVLATLRLTWPFLIISIVAAAALTTYLGTDRLEGWLRRRIWVGIVGAVALAALTPFCSCGTTAVLIAGMASSTPWAPLVAFMVSSPLTSPAELLLSAGLMGWPFALTFFIGTIIIGLAAGGLAATIERTGWLRGQARVRASDSRCEDACTTRVATGPGTASVHELPSRSARLRDFGRELLLTGRRLLAFFLVFTTVGYMVIRAIPTGWVTGLLGGGATGAIPLAALVGVPAYVNTEASLPLVAALVDGGMGTGAALSFVVTGAGASVGSVAGLLVIARRRVVGLVVGILLVGGMLLGWAGEMIL